MQSHREGTWLGSPNFWADREGHSMAIAPSYVVLHTMVGTIESANSRFQQRAQEASAHYGVGSDGRIVQWVDEKDAAWHAGFEGVNDDSIGIEHEDHGDYNGVRPDALYNASAALVRGICKRYNIPIVHSHLGVSGIITHRETGYATACPDALNTNRIILLAAGIPAPVQPPSPPPVPGPAAAVVVPLAPVAGIVWRAAHYVDWATLQPRDAVPVGTKITWGEAKLVNGRWYDRVLTPAGPVDWGLDDADVDDGGHTPDYFRPIPKPPPPPLPPPLPPVKPPLPPVVPPVVPVPPVTPPVAPPVVPPVTPPDPVPDPAPPGPPPAPAGTMSWFTALLDWLLKLVRLRS